MGQSGEEAMSGPGTILPPTNQDVIEEVRGMRTELRGLINLALEARSQEVEQLRETVSKDVNRLDRKNREQDARLELLERQLAEMKTIPSPPPEAAE